MRSPDGFLSLRPPAGSADTDQLIVPTMHLQVHCMEQGNLQTPPEPFVC